MRKENRTFSIILCIASLAVILTANVFASSGEYLSPIGVVAAPDGKTLYIAQATGKQIDCYDIATEKVVKTVAVCNKLIHDYDSAADGGHGRVEVRNVWYSEDVQWMPDRQQ